MIGHVLRKGVILGTFLTINWVGMSQFLEVLDHDHLLFQTLRMKITQIERNPVCRSQFVQNCKFRIVSPSQSKENEPIPWTSSLNQLSCHSDWTWIPGRESFMKKKTFLEQNWFQQITPLLFWQENLVLSSGGFVVNIECWVWASKECAGAFSLECPLVQLDCLNWKYCFGILGFQVCFLQQN